MELYQLRTFVAVAEEGHLTRAAGRINASQSAVSAQIKALEEELGVPLFERTAKGMRLTKDGEPLLDRARATISSAETMLDQARALRAELTGAARVGLNSCPDLLRGTKLLAALRQSHPNLELHFANSMSHLILEEIAAGRMDGGFVFGDIPQEMDAIRVQSSRMRVAAPIAWKERIEQADLAALADMPWIITTPECPYTQYLDRLLKTVDARINVVATVDDEDLLVSLAKTGNGLSLVREEQAVNAAQRGEVALWPDSPGEMSLSFVTHSRRRNERLVSALRGAVRTVWDLPPES